MRLEKDGAALAETTTDAFGDFKFDRLEPDGSIYAVAVESDGHAPQRHEVTLTESVSLGEIRLAQ